MQVQPGERTRASNDELYEKDDHGEHVTSLWNIYLLQNKLLFQEGPREYEPPLRGP